jgi:hypothetical protein
MHAGGGLLGVEIRVLEGLRTGVMPSGRSNVTALALFFPAMIEGLLTRP